MMVTHYLVLGAEYNVLFMLMSYFQLVLETIVFYYFASETGKLFDSRIYKNYAKPLVAAHFAILTGFAVFFVVENNKTQIYDCTNPIWLYMRSSGLLLTLWFIVLGIILPKKLKKLQSIDSLMVDLGRTKELW